MFHLQPLTDSLQVTKIHKHATEKLLHRDGSHDLAIVPAILHVLCKRR